MRIHPVFGPVASELGWVPAPRYLLRRSRVLKMLEYLPRGSLLEVGCGPGILLQELSAIGFDCTSLETSLQALDIGNRINEYFGNRINFNATAHDEWIEYFDVIIALEVLEHIKDDKGALSQWIQWLRPGGWLLISVPAHMSRWNASDKWAGHYRRYEKQELLCALQRVGMTIKRIESYGFPLANLMEPISAWNRERKMRSSDFSCDQDAKTSYSGVERQTESRLFPLLSSWPGVKTLQFFCWLQSLFVGTDLGNGYLVLARK